MSEAVNSQLDQVEAAIKAGDLTAAASHIEDLKPLLVSDNIEELKRLRSRIDELKISVRSRRSSVKNELGVMVQQKRAVQRYQTIYQES